MKLRHIEIFHAVMQAGSISKAAELLAISQPAASKILIHAEQTIGMKLFLRTPAGLRPTREAELLFAETKILYSNLETVRKLARNLTLLPNGYLRIGCVPSLGFTLVPKAIANLTKAYPDIGISIQTHHMDELCNLLLARELDIAITFSPQSKPGIKATAIGQTRVVYVGPENEKNHNKPIKLEQLRPHGLIGINNTEPLGLMIEEKRREAGLPEWTPAIEVQTYYLAKALVSYGVGYTLIDEFTARAAGHALTIRPITPELRIGIYALTAEKEPYSQICILFIDKLSHQFPHLH